MLNKPRRPWIAALLTLPAKGLGHLYAGRPRRGIILFGIDQFLAVAFASSLIITPSAFVLVIGVVVGLAFTIFCILDAVSIARKSNQTYEMAKYNRWFVYFAYFLIMILTSTLISKGIKTNLSEAFRFPSGSMEPTLLRGDHIIADRTRSAREPQRGDVIVFKYPQDPRKDFLKRVVAIEGDTVEVRNKVVYVNGKANAEPYVVHRDANIMRADLYPRDFFGPKVVPAGSYFVMGDNRDQSYDSRFWGFVPKANIKGTIKSIYWSWDREKLAVRWIRIGMKVK